MKGIGSAFSVEVDHAAGKTPVLGAKIVGLDLEFLNGVLCWNYGDNVQIRSVGWHAVDQDLALPRHASANLKVSESEGIGADWSARRGIASRGLALRHNAGRHSNQRQRIAAIQRQFRDRSLFHDLPEGICFRLEQGRFGL